MTVQAKFRCTTIVDTSYGGEYKQRHVKFSAVYGKSGDNATYSQATPWGEMTLQIDQSTPAYEHFQPGKEYYLTFTQE